MSEVITSQFDERPELFPGAFGDQLTPKERTLIANNDCVFDIASIAIGRLRVVELPDELEQMIIDSRPIFH